MKMHAAGLAALMAFVPTIALATGMATTSHTDHVISVEKGNAVERVARDMAHAELEQACASKGGSIVQVTYKSTPIWGGSHPVTRVQATAVCRVSGAE